MNNLTVLNSFENDIQKYGTFLNFDKDQYLFGNKEELKNVYFIISGRIKVSEVNLETGKEQILRILSKGDIYDLVAILDSKPREYIISTLDNVQMIELPIKIVRDWINTSKEFRSFFFAYTAESIKRLEDLTVSLSLEKSSTRLVKLILDSARMDSHKYEYIKDLNHEQIAAIIGSIRNVVNRDLQKLKEEGLIDISRKKISIKDQKKLLEKL